MTSAIHVVGITEHSFGLADVALNLMKYQNRLGSHSAIWCLSPAGLDWPANGSALEAGRVRRFGRSGPGFLGYTPQMEREVRAVAQAERPDVVHQHSIWTALSRVTREWGKCGVPTVVAAHGALQPWALRKSAWKKRLASLAWESRNLNEAACLHACGSNEIDDYRNFSLKNPVALMPNAIADDWIESAGSGERFRARIGVRDEQRILLYVGRVTPKKGLPMLLEAMSELREQLEQWVLVIAGPDEFGHQAELVEQVQALGLAEQVLFAGLLTVQEKRDAFEAAELFVLPTYSEGSPMVVLEALGAGVPVLTTKGTPWQDLEQYRCGWWCDISVAGIFESLKVAVSLPKEELSEAGERGLALVRSKYNWTEIAAKTIRLYDWLAGRAGQPEFVSTV